MESVAVTFGKTFRREVCGTIAELGKRLNQRKPDNGQQSFLLGQWNAMRSISPGHGANDHVLAVDKRAVAVKYH